MKENIFAILRFLVRWVRKVRRVIKISDLKLHGVDIPFSAVVDPAAVFEPSGGRISIGRNTFVDRGVIFRGLGGPITVGSDCSVNAYSVLFGSGGLSIGDNVRIAAHTVIVPSNHVFSDTNVPIQTRV